MTEPNIPPGFDFTDPDMYADRLPMDEFAELRRTAPVWWNRKPRGVGGFDDEGYWVVTRHADVVAVSRDNDNYSTWENTAIIRHQDGASREQIELQRFVMLNIDPPQHTKLRGIVSRGFTPRAINNLRSALSARAERIVADAIASGSGDFVTDVAAELPLQAIAELVGVPQDDRRKVFDWSNDMVGYDDPEYVGDPAAAAAELVGYAMVMAEDRRQCPRDDIVTKLVNAQVDGGELSSDEFGFFVILLAVAGNETTRNAISHGMHAFLENPDQWELFKASGRTPRPTRSCGGRPRSRCSSAPRWPIPPWAGSRSPPGSASACSTGRPTLTRRSSTIPSGSTSAAAPTPIWASAAAGRTSASVPASPGWRST